MICKNCRRRIYEVPQHLGDRILVHEDSGIHHCDPNFERSGDRRTAEMMNAEAAA